MAAASQTQVRATPVSDDQLHDLGWALGAVLRSWHNATTEAVSKLPGGPRGYQVLSMATDGPCGTQAAMAERLGIDRTVMTHLIDDLERTGLVERRPDPADRRARHIALTETGRSAYENARDQVAAVERGVLAGLDDESARRFRDLLHRAAAAVEDHPLDACEAVLELDDNRR